MPPGSQELWVGEGAMAYNSGREGVTDSFVGSLWHANLLGALSKTVPLPHAVYCRQALVGGNYGLVSHETLDPNPDYWASYVWKRLVGTRAVGPIRSPQRHDSAEYSNQFTFGCCEEPGADAVLVHAFCSAGGSRSPLGGEGSDVVFVAINISPDEGVRLEVDLGEGRTDVSVFDFACGLSCTLLL